MALQSLRAMPDHQGTVIRRWRERRGWTVSELARRSGLGARFLQQTEAGKNQGSLTIRHLEQIALAFEASTSELHGAIFVADVFDRADRDVRYKMIRVGHEATGMATTLDKWRAEAEAKQAGIELPLSSRRRPEDETRQAEARVWVDQCADLPDETQVLALFRRLDTEQRALILSHARFIILRAAGCTFDDVRADGEQGPDRRVQHAPA